jgi:hypothetical protein
MLSIRKTAALGLAAAVLAVGFVAAAPIIGAKAEEGSEKWLVDDAEAVVVVNFKAFFGSGLLTKGDVADKFKKKLESDEKVKAFVDATGLDVTKDLDSFIMSASKISDKASAKGRMVLKGSFDVAKLTAAMKKADNVVAAKAGGIDVFEIKAQDQTLYGAFAGKSAFVMTQDKDETVDLAKNGATKAPKTNKDLEAALKKFTGKEAFAMVLLVTEEMKKQAGANPQVAKSVGALTTVTIATTVTDAVDVNIVGNTTDGKAAGSIAKQLTGLHAIGSAAIGAMEQIPQPAKDLFDAIKIDSTRDSVTISLNVSKETIEKAAKMEK